MISQLIPGENTFLVDAFVQPGYSGSPVFVIREEGQNLPPQWSYYFVGIAQAYPYSTSPIYRDVGLVPVDSMKVIENPGFARVVGTHLVKRLFGLSK